FTRLRVEPAGIRDLTTCFEVEGRASQRRETGLPRSELGHLTAILVEEREHGHVANRRIRVTVEVVAGAAEHLACVSRLERELLILFRPVERALRPRLFPLAFHRAVERHPVEPKLAVLDHVLDEVERETE